MPFFGSGRSSPASGTCTAQNTRRPAAFASSYACKFIETKVEYARAPGYTVYRRPRMAEEGVPENAEAV